MSCISDKPFDPFDGNFGSSHVTSENSPKSATSNNLFSFRNGFDLPVSYVIGVSNIIRCYIFAVLLHLFGFLRRTRKDLLLENSRKSHNAKSSQHTRRMENPPAKKVAAVEKEGWLMKKGQYRWFVLRNFPVSSLSWYKQPKVSNYI